MLPLPAVWRRLATRDSPALGGHAKLSALIGSHLGPQDAGLLAAPDLKDDGTAAWRSLAGGALAPATDDAPHRAAIARVAALADRLDGQGDAGALAAHALRSALTTPAGAQAFYVDTNGGAPVLVNWGLAAPGQAVPELPDALARPAPAAPIPAAPVRAGAGLAGAGLAALAWLVPAALAALLAVLAFEAATPLPPLVTTITPDAPPAHDPVTGLPARLSALKVALTEADAAQTRIDEICVAPPPPEPILDPVVPPPLPPRVVTVDPPPPTPVVPRADRPAPPKPAKPRAAPAKSACTPTWPPGRAPRMVFVVDGSGSMRDGIPGARSRMDASKRAISAVVRGLHKDIRVGMVSFSDCGDTRNSKFYSAPERGALLGKVNGMRPGQATSLAASIRRGGKLAPRRSESVLVVVSDGADTCGQDPCAAARAARAAKPNLRINVIDLSGGGSSAVLQCIARAGGGRVFKPGSAGQMSLQVQQATGQPDASGCE